VARLRQEAQPHVSLLAERAGRPIGHVFFSPLRIEGEAGAPRAGGLAPVGVLPGEQGCGAGGALIRAGVETCRALGWSLLFVLGDPAYYRRFDFGPAAPHGLHYESPEFDRAFQVLELVSGALASARGRVRYPPAFAALGS
jgi:putative acetyltransferase